MPSPMEPRQTFDVLNGLRGVAAVAVVAMHLFFYMGGLHPANVALAVDFFFVLSGFVIACAYEPQLLAGLPFHRFVAARLIRLYPLYLIGLAIGAAAMWTCQRPADVGGFAAHLALNLVMLPSPAMFDPADHHLFPLNFPYWSLFFELAANLVYAALAPRLSNRLLATVILLGFVELVASGVGYGTLDIGIHRATILGGLARVVFSFFAGVGLYRLWRVRPTRIALHPALLFALLILPLMVAPGAPFGWLYELAVIAIYMPLMVWLGAGARAGRWRGVSIALGAMSYPVYVIHVPIWTAIRAFNGWQGNTILHRHAPWSGIALVISLCALAWWLDRYVDHPLRRRLANALLHRPLHARDRLRVSRVGGGA